MSNIVNNIILSDLGALYSFTFVEGYLVFLTNHFYREVVIDNSFFIYVKLFLSYTFCMNSYFK